MKETRFLVLCGLMLAAVGYILATDPQRIVDALAFAVLAAVFLPIMAIPILWLFGR